MLARPFLRRLEVQLSRNRYRSRVFSGSARESRSRRMNWMRGPLFAAGH